MIKKIREMQPKVAWSGFFAIAYFILAIAYLYDGNMLVGFEYLTGFIFMITLRKFIIAQIKMKDRS